MTIDSNHVPDTVKALLEAELSSSVASFRMLDEPEADSQKRYGYPLVEIEFPGADLQAEESGDPGNNIWSEGKAGAPTAFMVHVHIKKDQSMAKAREVMDVVVAIFAGRTHNGVDFFGALVPFEDDGDGKGVSRGVSRGIEYRYEFLHR